MQFLKVNCTSCKCYLECPQRTRLFINYCGSDRKKVEENIKDAIHDCRARRGILLTNGILFTDSELLAKTVSC